MQCHEFDSVADDGGSYKNSSIDKENFVADYLTVITFYGQAGLDSVKAGFDLTQLHEYVDSINMTIDSYILNTSGNNNDDAKELVKQLEIKLQQKSNECTELQIELEFKKAYEESTER